MSRIIRTEPLTPEGFAPFGDVLEVAGTPDKVINQGMCHRYHDRAALDFFRGHAGISVFDATPRSLPHVLDMMERHPDGSQAFVPMHGNDWLVIVAPDADGAPGTPRAFLAGAGQGVNFFRNTWHGVLTPLHAPGLFAVIDRIGGGENLEEYWFDTAWRVEAS
ncbi:ureidoglycolate lyase [Jannaschia rubra]|uniref:Ureidoglycolate hydrolase n=1 Tax=Jannaschia rubra TaxID=282197 RepID=A0A0M6XM88_9RHOB|nr:ureidoglycolate lyase [Jannaschia rubra]CTQ32266.1 Ureidoglycolate hydrolase [Jannaschia rubra]SFG48651.1 ureidoglycolate lyase [Jannaschia rubra]